MKISDLIEVLKQYDQNSVARIVEDDGSWCDLTGDVVDRYGEPASIGEDSPYVVYLRAIFQGEHV